MSKVAIVTDTTCCLPEELVQEYNIKIGSVNIIFGEKVYRDQLEITTDEFWKLFYQAEKLPTTTGVALNDFANIFRELSKTTDSILCIVISKELSNTFEAATLAKKMVDEEIPGVQIEVVDSRTTTGALGLITLEAARAAAQGQSLEQVTALANSMIQKVHWIAMLETLHYLAKGGRAPKMGAWIGDLVQLKPLIGMSGEGTVQARGRVRTTQKALSSLIEFAKRSEGNNPVHAIVHYGELVEEGQKLKEVVASQLNCVELYTTGFTPVMCAHLGPVIGVSFYAEESAA
jgi:DegV family protein with EDD domain